MDANTKTIKRAETLCRSLKAEDVHPDVAARMASFTRQQDAGANDRAVLAHARALVKAADALGVDTATTRTARKRAKSKSRGKRKS